MAVRLSPSGKWIIDYRPEGTYGKRMRKVIDALDEDAARRVERSMLAVVKSRCLPVSTSIEKRVSDLFPDYLDHCRQHKQPGTVKDVEMVYTAHFSRLLGDIRLGELTTADLRLYKTTRGAEKIIKGFTKKKDGEKRILNRTVGPRTINKELAYFMGFLKWCRRDLDMDLPPLKVDNLKAPRPIPIILTPEEVRKIIDASEPVHKALILLLYSLGLRFSEAAGLLWENVDLAGETLRVVQKGGGMKVLPLNEWVKSSLEGIDRRGRYVFPSRDENKPLGDIRKALAGICKRAGVTKKVTPHLFRHTIATHLMADGAGLRQIQKYLGHSQLVTTTWYTHVETDHLREATKATLGAVLTRRTEK